MQLRSSNSHFACFEFVNSSPLKWQVHHCTTSHHVAKSKCFASTRSWILQCAPLSCTSWVLGRRKYKQATDEMISWKAVGMNNVVGGLQQNRWDDKMTRCALHRWCSGATFTCEFQSQNKVANLKQDFSHLTASGPNQWWLVGRRLDTSNSSDKWGKGNETTHWHQDEDRDDLVRQKHHPVHPIATDLLSNEANLLSPPFFSAANRNRCAWVCTQFRTLFWEKIPFPLDFLRQGPILSQFRFASKVSGKCEQQQWEEFLLCCAASAGVFELFQAQSVSGREAWGSSGDNLSFSSYANNSATTTKRDIHAKEWTFQFL